MFTEMGPKVISIRDSLVNYFDGACKLRVLTQGAGTLFAIETPLARFDDIDVVIFVKPIAEGWLLHDGGKTISYLNDHSIDLLSASQKHRLFREFFLDLAEKHGLSLSREARRLEMSMNEVNGRNVLTFVECIVALSFLVMVKQTGLTPLTVRSLMNLADLRVTLQKALPGVLVKEGIRPSARGVDVFHRWGISLFAQNNHMTGCVQYLDGDTWDKVSRNILITGALFRTCKDWLRIPPDNFITVYAGPSEYLSNTRKVLDQFRNGAKPRLITLENRKELLTAVLSMPQLKRKTDPQKALRVIQETSFLVARTRAEQEPIEMSAKEPSLEDIWEMYADEYRREVDVQSAIANRAEAYRLLLGSSPYRDLVKVVTSRGSLSREEIRRISGQPDVDPILDQLIAKNLLTEKEGVLRPSHLAGEALGSIWAKSPSFFKN